VYALIENPCTADEPKKVTTRALWPELPTRPTPCGVSLSPSPFHRPHPFIYIYIVHCIPYIPSRLYRVSRVFVQAYVHLYSADTTWGGDIFNQVHPDPMPNPIVEKPSWTYTRAFVCQAQLSWSSVYRSDGIGSPNQFYSFFNWICVVTI